METGRFRGWSLQEPSLVEGGVYDGGQAADNAPGMRIRAPDARRVSRERSAPKSAPDFIALELLHLQHVQHFLEGIELHVIALRPSVAFAGEQIVHAEDGFVLHAEGAAVEAHVSALRVARV